MPRFVNYFLKNPHIQKQAGRVGTLDCKLYKYTKFCEQVYWQTFGTDWLVKTGSDT